MGQESDRATAVRPEEEPSLVVVVGMEIIPENRWSLEYGGEFLDGGEGNSLGDHLRAWRGGKRGGERNREKKWGKIRNGDM